MFYILCERSWWRDNLLRRWGRVHADGVHVLKLMQVFFGEQTYLRLSRESVFAELHIVLIASEQADGLWEAELVKVQHHSSQVHTCKKVLSILGLRWCLLALDQLRSIIINPFSCNYFNFKISNKSNSWYKPNFAL